MREQTIFILNLEQHLSEFDFEGVYLYDKENIETPLLMLSQHEESYIGVIDGADNGKGAYYTESISLLDSEETLLHIKVSANSLTITFNLDSSELLKEEMRTAVESYLLAQGHKIEKTTVLNVTSFAKSEAEVHTLLSSSGYSLLKDPNGSFQLGAYDVN